MSCSVPAAKRAAALARRCCYSCCRPLASMHGPGLCHAAQFALHAAAALQTTCAEGGHVPGLRLQCVSLQGTMKQCDAVSISGLTFFLTSTMAGDASSSGL
jgi:hypothetical protein